MMCEWVDSLSTERLEGVCSVGLYTVFVTVQEPVNPTLTNTTLRELGSKSCLTNFVDMIPGPLFIERPPPRCEFDDKVEYSLLFLQQQPCLFVIKLGKEANT